MVKEKVSFLCGNIKKNILRRSGTVDNSAPGSPSTARNITSTSSFDKNNTRTSSDDSREEILCIFDKSLTLQHDTDDISTSFEIPPEPPPRIYFPQARSPKLTGSHGGERIESVQLIQPVIEGANSSSQHDDRTPSEHSRSTASEIFSHQAPSISSSHSSNSSTESFHCEGCHCSRKSSQLHIANCSGNHASHLHYSKQIPNYSYDEYSKTTSTSSHQSVSIGSSDSLDIGSLAAEHSYSAAHQNRLSTTEAILPPRIKPSALGSCSRPEGRRRSGCIASQQQSKKTPSPQPPPFLPPKNFIPSTSSSGKKCECANCRLSYASSKSSNSSSSTQACETISIIDRNSTIESLNMTPCTPKRNPRLCERKVPKDCPEYENHLENTKPSESSWPEIGEVVPTVSAFLQSKNCSRRRSSFSKSFDKVSLSLTVHEVFQGSEMDSFSPKLSCSEQISGNDVRLMKKTRQSLLHTNPGWFWGQVSVDEAEALLNGRENGSFLVRDSASNPTGAFSLSFRCQGATHHTRIEIKHGKFTFSNQPEGHVSNSLDSFIRAAIENSKTHSFLYFLKINNNNPSSQSQQPIHPSTESQSGQSNDKTTTDSQQLGVPAKLIEPFSRHLVPHALKYLCRLFIRQKLNHLEDLKLLNLDSELEEYLHLCPFYDRSLVHQLCNFNE